MSDENEPRPEETSESPSAEPVPGLQVFIDEQAEIDAEDAATNPAAEPEGEEEPADEVVTPPPELQELPHVATVEPAHRTRTVAEHAQLKAAHLRRMRREG